MPNGGRHHSPHGAQKGKQENEILEKIKELGSFKDLKPEEFALPGKMADRIAQADRRMKTSQLRKFFTKIKNIEKKLKGKSALEEDLKNEMYMIVPELAYALGRELIGKDSYDTIATIIKEKIRSKEDFINFSRFMTAIVAYKKKGGA